MQCLHEASSILGIFTPPSPSSGPASGARAGRASMTHPIGIRRLQRLFIGPRRPQKALGLAFSSLSPSLPLPPWLQLSVRGERRKGWKAAAVPECDIPEHGEDCGPSATASARQTQSELINFSTLAFWPGAFSSSFLFLFFFSLSLDFFLSHSPFLFFFLLFIFFPPSLRSFASQLLARACLFLGTAG